MADHAKRDQTRTGFEVELTPASSLGVTFAYFRRNVEFPDRPAEAANDPASFSGLLSAKYDSFTGEVDFTPEREDGTRAPTTPTRRTRDEPVGHAHERQRSTTS